MSAYLIPDHEIEQWAKVRADDAGHLARTIVAERERHGWQPIETAPLDEMLILCGHKWDGDRSPIKIGYWRETHWHIFGASWKPTHWMPLPSPPKQ